MSISNSVSVTRSGPLAELYDVLEQLCEKLNGPHYLRNYDDLDFPRRGVYLFFAPGSDFTKSANSWHLSRIGTVGVSEGSEHGLQSRLRQHRGNTRGKYSSGGNSRGSIFRVHVGQSFINRDSLSDEYPDWGTPLSSVDRDTQELREEEHPLEKRVSAYIRSLPLLWIPVNDEPGPNSDRAYLERNLIPLVSQRRRQNPSLFMPSDGWLGGHARAEISQSGLWNLDYINSLYDPSVVDTFQEYVEDMPSVK